MRCTLISSFKMHFTSDIPYSYFLTGKFILPHLLYFCNSNHIFSRVCKMCVSSLITYIYHCHSKWILYIYQHLHLIHIVYGHHKCRLIYRQHTLCFVFFFTCQQLYNKHSHRTLTSTDKIKITVIK